MRGKGKKGSEGIVPAVLAWMVSAVLLLLLGAWIVSKTDLREGSLPYCSAVIVFLSSAVASGCCTRSRGSGKGAVLIGVICAAVLLMLGFIVDSTKMTFTGLCRTVISAVAGSAAGVFPASKLRGSDEGKRFALKRKTG